MSALRVYVAGASAEVDIVAEYIARLRWRGVVITYDWTPDVIAARAAGVKDVDMTDADRERYVSGDYAAIARADIFWLLVPEAATIGAWAEMGFAHGVGTVAIASGHALRRTIFTQPCRPFATHEEAFKHLVERNAAMFAGAA